MATNEDSQLLKNIPSVSRLLATDVASQWLSQYPHKLVADCIRDALESIRRQIRDHEQGGNSKTNITQQSILAMAERELIERSSPQLRSAINATGIILHTGLGRAVWPQSVVDSMAPDLKGYVTLAVDRQTGLRSERDNRIESIFSELTGAEAATVVNNNAAATLVVLAALGAEREVIVSRGQLIEIGGSFRLPDVMAQSTAQLREVGTTNRTHPKDYADAITPNTAAIMRVHPSNFRVVGFTSETPLEELVKLAHAHGLAMIDDLGAGALVDLRQFGLAHEPMVSESIAAGADVVLFSTDKLIGASQGGAIVGRAEYIERIRKHPLSRALRPDKSCLMALERTLHLFRDPDRLRQNHPTYKMLTTPIEVVRRRGEALAEAINDAVPQATTQIDESVGYLGSGSLPMNALPTWVVAVSAPGMSASELAKRLRTDEACVFARIEADRLVMDPRTITDEQIPAIAGAFKRTVK